MGEGCINQYFLDLGTSCRWVVGFTPRPLYPRGKSPQYPLDRMLCGPQAGLDDVEKIKLLTVPGLELRPLGRLASRHTDYTIPAPLKKITRPTLNSETFRCAHMQTCCEEFFLVQKFKGWGRLFRRKSKIDLITKLVIRCRRCVAPGVL
jgi:hypothetical protein